MVRPIVKDRLFLSLKSEEATKEDLPIGKDLLDTVRHYSDCCVGLAANSIGIRKRIIALSLRPLELIMYNPVIVKKEKPYTTTEKCLSLGETETTVTRYETIEVEFRDTSFVKRRAKFVKLVAEVIQHEADHLDGIVV